MADEFDLDAARKSGYSDAEIADFLSQEHNFDLNGARAAGYQDGEIVGSLASRPRAISAEELAVASEPYREMRPLRREQARPAAQPTPVDRTPADDMLRRDGTRKGQGFFGPLKTPDGKVATEYTVGVEINGKETDIPTLVPTLTQTEIDQVLSGKVSDPVVAKARAHAEQRIKQGKSVFAEPGEAKAQGGFAPAAKQIIGTTIKGAGQAASDFIPGVGKDNPLTRYGQSVVEANPTVIHGFQDIAEKPLTTVTEATGNVAGSMAGIVGARAVGGGITALAPLAGPAAPIVAGIGQAIAWFGPAAMAALPSFSGIRDKQILNDPNNEVSAKAKAIAVMGSAAVGAIETAFGPQRWALAMMTKEGRDALAKKFVAATLPGRIAKGSATGGAIEGAEELVQNPIEQLASFDDPTTWENVKETLFGGTMGAVGGGVLGGGFGAISNAQAKRQAAEAALAGGPPVAPPGGPVPGSAADLRRAMAEPTKPLAEARQEDARAALAAATAEEEAVKSEFQRAWEEQEAELATQASAVEVSAPVEQPVIEASIPGPTPVAASAQPQGEPNASPVRSDQRKDDEKGNVEGQGAEPSGRDLQQQAPSEADVGPAPGRGTAQVGDASQENALEANANVAAVRTAPEPVPRKAKAVAPAVLERIAGEDGMEVVITKGKKGFHATLRDTEADQSVSTTIHKSLGLARVGAKGMLGGKAPAQVIPATEATLSDDERLRRLESVENKSNHAPYEPLSDDELRPLVDAGLVANKGPRKGRLTDSGRSALNDLRIERKRRQKATDDAIVAADLAKPAASPTEPITPAAEQAPPDLAKVQYVKQYPGDAPAEVAAKNRVVDAMNGDITVDQLIDELRVTGLPGGTLTAITERLGDMMSAEQQRRLLAPGQFTAQPEPVAPVAEATHVEDGKIHEVTREVIRESVAEGAENTTMTLAQQRDALLVAVDRAVGKAPNQTDAPIEEWNFVRFDVPGDGVFKVLNTKERLRQFGAQAKSAFAKAPTPRMARKQKSWSPGTQTPEAAVRELLEDREPLNAYGLAKNIGKPLGFGSSGSDRPVAYTNISAVTLDALPDVDFFVGRSTGKGGGSWSVIHADSGLSAGAAGNKDDAVAKSNEVLQSAIDRGEDVAAKITRQPKNSQAKLEKEWLEWARKVDEETEESAKRAIEIAAEVERRRAEDANGEKLSAPQGIFSDRYIANQGAIIDGILALAKQIVPQVDTAVVSSLFMAGEHEIAGRRLAAQNIIEVSLRYEDPQVTLRHEAVHSFFDMGLLTGGEQRVLNAKADEWRTQYDVDARYPSLSGDETALNEEGIADAYGAYRGGEKFGGLIQPAFAKITRFLQRLGNFLRSMGFQTVEDVFSRMESGEVGRRPARQTKAPPGEKLSKPTEGITTRVHGVEDVVLDRETLTPERTQGSIDHAKRIFEEVGLDVVPRGKGLWDVANKGAEVGELDAIGHKLLEALRREIRSQNNNPESPEIASLLTSVAEYVASSENVGMSAALRTKLYGVAQGERSHRGLLLGALAQVGPESLQRLARNVEGALERVYAEQFGGDGWGRGKDTGAGAIDGTQDILDDVLKRFRESFTDEELGKIAEHSTELMKLIEGLASKAEAQDVGGRLYRKIHWMFKEKKAKWIKALAEDARLNEAAQKIIEDLKQFGLEPKERPGKKALTALERLLLMVSPKTSEAIDTRIAQAIAEAERNAGVKAALAEATADERGPMAEAFQQGLEPTPEMVEKGLQADEFKHWRVLRDNLVGYSPTTLKLAQQVVQGTFRGTRFGQPAPKPVDLRIDLAKLARAPEIEVRRVLDAAMQAIEDQMSLVGATPETLLRVSAMIRGQVEIQLEAARKRVVDRALVPPAAPGAALTPEQRLRELFNAGLLGDPRMDDRTIVRQVAAKSMVKRLAPNLQDMVKRVFETPFYRQSDLETRFGREVSGIFGLDAAQRAKAEELFRAAYEAQFAKAKAKALDAVRKQLSPKQQKTVRKVPALWERIEATVNSGAFDSAAVMQAIARARGWTVPDAADLKEIKTLANREQELRELSPEAEAKAEMAGELDDALRDQAAATLTERALLKREMQALWLRWTAPMGWKTADQRRNIARAVNEITSANLLLLPRFFVRQLIDVGTQTAIYTPTRATMEAIKRYQADKVVRGRETRLWRDVDEALRDAYVQRAKTLRAAMSAIKRSLAGRSETKNVEQILDNISIFDRAELKANELSAQGKTVQAFLMRMVTHFGFAFAYAKALDQFQGVLAGAQETQAMAITELREHGLTPEQARQTAKWIMGDTQAEFLLALARTQEIFDASGIETTPARLEQSAWDVVKSRQYARVAFAQLDAEDYAAQNRILLNVIGWNEREMGGFGGVIAGFGRAITEFSEKIGLPMPLARFSNAIGISINRVLTFTPLGFFPKAFEGSAWYRTERDITQRKVEAAAGTAVGLAMMALVLAGVIVVRFKWPDDEAERDLWRRIGRQPGTIEIMTGGGKYITISMMVGPLSFVRPYLVFMGSILDSLDKYAKKVSKLVRKAEEQAAQPAMSEQKSMDILYAALLAAYSTFMGGRTAVGIISNLTGYRIPQVERVAAGFVSPMLPGAPQWQGISRTMWTQVDPKRASFLDFVFPTSGTEEERRNFFYDPLNDNTTERITKVLTGGTYPLATLPMQKDTEKAYRVLAETGWRPPAVANHARLIGDQYRAFDPDELEKYRELRGRNLKREIAAADLAGLSENEKLDELDAIAQEANQDAVDDVIDMIERKTGGSGISPKVPALKMRAAP